MSEPDGFPRKRRGRDGGGGIRTHEGPGWPLAIFKTAAFDHSATPPGRRIHRRAAAEGWGLQAAAEGCGLQAGAVRSVHVDPAAVRRSYADAEPRPFWLAQPGAPDGGDPLDGNREADLVVVGGGLTGLWAALLAKEEDPGREVVLLEGERIAFGATGRNGGFMGAPPPPRLQDGGPPSPTYNGALHLPDGRAIVDPARLAWGLASAARDLGVRVHEHSQVTSLEREGAAVVPRTAAGSVTARRAILATSAFPPLVRAIRRYVVPVYDYVLVTEPLPPDRRDALGWQRRQGLTDLGNLFHYYRLTSDDRVLWGGYDAVYNFRNGMGPHLDERPATFELLATHFFETFPQLDGVRFTHRWGGAIDTCSRFSVIFGRALEGRAVYAVGYTGLGVAASRFGAQVALDLAAGRDTERTRLKMVRSKPIPFPPEPLRWAGITLTRRALAKADRREGRRGPWLRALDRLGMGFDS